MTGCEPLEVVCRIVRGDRDHVALTVEQGGNVLKEIFSCYTDIAVYLDDGKTKVLHLVDGTHVLELSVDRGYVE